MCIGVLLLGKKNTCAIISVATNMEMYKERNFDFSHFMEFVRNDLTTCKAK